MIPQVPDGGTQRAGQVPAAPMENRTTDTC